MRRVIEEVITSLTRNQVVHHGLVGSNPTLSARKIQPASGFAVCRLFLVYLYIKKASAYNSVIPGVYQDGRG